MAIQQPTDDNIVSGVQQGQTLGVTEVAPSDPQKDEEVLVAGVLSKLVEIPGIKKKVQSVLSDAEPEDTLLNVKKNKVETTEKDLQTNIEPTPNQGLDVDISVKPTKADETKFELDTDAIEINFDKINTPQDFQNVINDFIDNLPAPKVQSENQTKLLAEELNIKPQLLSGSGFKNAEEVYAARVFIQQSGEYLLKLADEVLKDTTGNQLLQIRFKKQLVTHGLFVQQFMKGRANVGRALSAFKIPVMKDAGDQKEMINLIITQQGGSGSIQKIAETVQKPLQKYGMPAVHKLVEGNFFKRSSKAWSEAYRGGLLFSPKTMLRNVVGNAVFIAYTIPEYTIAGIYGTVENTLRGSYNLVRGRHWGDGQGGMTWELGAARIYGLVNGFVDAFRAANKSLRTGQSNDGFNKYEGANSEYFTAKNLGLENSIFAGAIDFMGKVYRLPYAGLQYGDEFFKEIARSMEMHTAIMISAQKMSANQGIPFKEALEKSILEIANDPDAFKKTLDEHARYMSFQDKLPLAIERYVTALQQTPLLGTIFLPFAKTPVNVSRRANDLTFAAIPGLFSKDQVKRNRAMAKITMASGAYIAISNFYAQGRITGGYPMTTSLKYDKKMKAALDAKGWRPYSLVFAADDHPDDMPLFDENGIPTGDHIYVSYQGLEPIGAILGVTAHALELKHRSNDPGVRDNIALSVVLASQAYLNEMPMLTGISDLVTALTEQKWGDVAKDSLTAIMSAPMLPLAPTSGTGYLLSGSKDEDGKFNIVNRNTDMDFERDMVLFLDDGSVNMNFGQQKDTRFFNPIIESFNEFVYKLPYDEAVGSLGNYIWGRDKNGEELPPEYDIFGNALMRDSGMGLMVDIVNTYLSPVGFKKVEAKPLHYHENERLGGIIYNPGKTIQGIPLTPREYSDFVIFSKKTKRQKYQNLDFEEYIQRYMNSSMYKNMDDVQKIKNIKKINADFIKLGKKDLLNKYTDTLGATILQVEEAIDRGIPLNNNILESNELEANQ